MGESEVIFLSIPGHERVEVTTTSASRKEDPDLPTPHTARRLRDTAAKSGFVVLTSMTDAARFPVAAIAHPRNVIAHPRGSS